MKNLLQTTSLSWAQSVKFALEAEGISAAVVDQSAQGMTSVADTVRVVIFNDGDLHRARAVLIRISPKFVVPRSWRWQKRGLQLLVLGFALLIVFEVLLDREESNRDIYLFAAVAASGLAFIAGFLLIALGPRADKEGS